MDQNDVRGKVNQLVDRFESGDLNRRDLFRAAAALGVLSTGLGSWVDAVAQGAPTAKAQRDLRRTGFLAQVQSVDAAKGNAIKGVILPGAARFWQKLSAGEWQHKTVSGEGVIEIDGKAQKVAVGQSLTIPAGKAFTYVNEGKTAWTFEASHPFWSPDAFTYGLGAATLKGDEVWFDVRQSPEKPGNSGYFRIVAAEKGKNYAVISLDPGQSTPGMKSTVGASRLNGVAGEVTVEHHGAKASTGSLSRGKAMAVGKEDKFKAANHGKGPAIVELRPDPLRTWTPDALLWDFGGGDQKGNAIWFELVIPA